MKRLLAALLVPLAACGGRTTRPAPETPVETVTDELHGVKIADPYRWLENGDDERVKAWADAHNARTRESLDGFPGREKIRKRIEELNSAGGVFSPRVRKGRVFYQKRTALQNQPVLHVGSKVLLDPNTFSKDATIALDWWVPSDDGRLLAYGTSEGGSEISTLQILDVDGGTKLGDSIPYCRAASVAWLADNSGFYYTKYPKGDPYNRRVYFHKIGSTEEDPLVFTPGAKEDWPAVSISPDNRRVLVSVFQGWSKSELHLLDRQTGAWTEVVKGVDALFSAAVLDDRLLIYTNHEAPRHRILTAPIEDPQNWQVLVPEGESNLEEFVVVGGRIVTRELHRAYTRMRVFGFDGALQGDIATPTLGSVETIDGEIDGNEIVFDFTSFFSPAGVYRCDLATRKAQPFETVQTAVDTSGFEARQVEYPSKDGTKITMFLVHRKGLKTDGQNPTILYGYGGFNISLTPGWSGSRMMWLEHGGVFAMPNLRGGGEYGEAWHQAGMLANKQNTFDDYVAAAEWLVREKITSPGKLAIEGGSNGGLLVGAALTQRPDLFRAVVCAVPLLDMVRYHKFLIARLWIPEYGSADDAAQFRWLHAYSPYHRVKDGEKYPAVILMTADTDTRVDPCHARKMAARLLAATSSGRPILLRVEKKAGHGAGKPLSKAIEEATDKYCFVMEQLGVTAK